MDITRRCDYACRILRSAYECGDSYISIADVAEKEDVPYRSRAASSTTW